MTAYLLRQIDPSLWRAVKTKAAREGITIREVLLTALKLYVGRKPA